MFFSVFRDNQKPPRQRRPSLVKLSREDDALIDAFAKVMLEWELSLNEACSLLGISYLKVDVCRSLNAKGRAPSDEERERINMLALIVKMLHAHFARMAYEASHREQRKFWSNMDSRKWLEQYTLLDASASAWDMLMIGTLENIRAIKEAVIAET